MKEQVLSLIQNEPNFVIQNAFEKCWDVLENHNKIMVSVSGGSDSDIMLDMLMRIGEGQRCDFCFFDTGLEYAATIDHLTYLENKYDIEIKRFKAAKPIPTCVREYGVPFWSKYASEMLYRLQINGFQFEDEPYEVLIEIYPHCQTALHWWCNYSKGTDMYCINRSPLLKEFIVANPPDFKISAKCCDYAKKLISHKVTKDGMYDLVCLGIRKQENGIRAAAFKSCFDQNSNGWDDFRPVFWFSDNDKIEYCQRYDVIYSRCYTEYGLLRTGCFGCPFGKRFEEELAIIEKYEPKLFKAAQAIFGKGYDYTRRYLEFRNKNQRGKA